MDSKPTKDQIIKLLDIWIRQRPGLEYGNYREIKSYRAECRTIARQLSDARTMLRYISSPYCKITADELMTAFHSAYAGRLEIIAGKKPGTWEIDYTTGQYWSIEYRAAACAVMAQALWNYYRPEYAKAEHPGDSIRVAFRRMYGKGIQARWFN